MSAAPIGARRFVPVESEPDGRTAGACATRFPPGPSAGRPVPSLTEAETGAAAFSCGTAPTGCAAATRPASTRIESRRHIQHRRFGQKEPAGGEPESATRCINEASREMLPCACALHRAGQRIPNPSGRRPVLARPVRDRCHAFLPSNHFAGGVVLESLISFASAMDCVRSEAPTLHVSVSALHLHDERLLSGRRPDL